MPNKGLDYAIEVAKEIRSEIAGCSMSKVNNINISIGVSLYCPGDSKKMTIRKVDDLMYTAKAHGKNYISYEKNSVI